MATRTFQNIAGLRRAMRGLPKVANVELRDASGVISRRIADRASAQAAAQGGAAGLVAPTIRARSDRTPVVVMGSRKRLRLRGGSKRPRPAGTGRQTIGDLVFGAEFGGSLPGARQFRPHRGQDGYFLWPTIRAELPRAMDDWAVALYDAARRTR